MLDHPTFVHLTDLHIGNPGVPDDHLFSDTSAALAAILTDIKKLQPAPKFIVASGDLTNRGDAGAYREMLRIFDQASLGIPVIFSLGNHDERDGFYRVVLGQDHLDEHHDRRAPYFHDQVAASVHVIVLDSSTPNQIGGSIEPEQFAWLDQRLDAHAELPKLIVVHHPPSLDEDNYDGEWEALSCADTVRLRQMLAGRNVVGILSGHIHLDRVSNWHGIPVVVGIGQHAATDPLCLHDRLRMLAGASFAVGTLRPSGLTVSFVPQPSDRHELHSMTYEQIRQYIKPSAAAE